MTGEHETSAQPWGTLEERLLVCVINRHGTQSWDSSPCRSGAAAPPKQRCSSLLRSKTIKGRCLTLRSLARAAKFTQSRRRDGRPRVGAPQPSAFAARQPSHLGSRMNRRRLPI
ncbi:hypothetical protein ACFX12_025620 [Malus domestica]